MVISKLNKKVLVIILIFISITYTCGKMYEKQDEFEQKQNTEVEECKKSPFVAQTYYKISLYKYNEKEIFDMKVNILRKGKIVKTFYQTDKMKKYFSFDYENLMNSDTIKTIIGNDIYYIHSFENDYWIGYKPHKCFLNSYKINGKNYFEKRMSNYGENYSDSSPSIKEFEFKKKI